MIRCLARAIRASRALYPIAASTWIFAGNSGEGHVSEQREERSVLFAYGNDLRQTYRTMGQAAGVSDVDMHLLMNHSLPGVNAGYITRAKLVEDHLRGAQERLSCFMLTAGKTSSECWPRLPARRCVDQAIERGRHGPEDGDSSHLAKAA
jgi:hypothetical protein